MTCVSLPSFVAVNAFPPTMLTAKQNSSGNAVRVTSGRHRRTVSRRGIGAPRVLQGNVRRLGEVLSKKCTVWPKAEGANAFPRNTSTAEQNSSGNAVRVTSGRHSRGMSRRGIGAPRVLQGNVRRLGEVLSKKCTVWPKAEGANAFPRNTSTAEQNSSGNAVRVTSGRHSRGMSRRGIGAPRVLQGNVRRLGEVLSKKCTVWPKAEGANAFPPTMLTTEQNSSGNAVRVTSGKHVRTTSSTARNGAETALAGGSDKLAYRLRIKVKDSLRTL